MNPKMGDVGFKVGGKSYVLNMGVNALCFVEEHGGGLDAGEVLDRILVALPTEETPAPATKVRRSDVRLLFWAGLQRHHPGVDALFAGDLIQALSKSKSETQPLDLIIRSMQLCAPDAEDANATEDPPKAPAEADAGTGTASS